MKDLLLFEGRHFIDLTHTLSEDIPTWGGTCGFQQEIKLDYHQGTKDIKFRVQQLKMHNGIGTHIDAPAHCAPRGQDVSQLALDKLIAPCIMIDVSARCHEQYKVTSQDIINFEQEHGVILPHCFVIIYTGWEQFWSNPQRYRNNHVFPSLSKEGAQTLLERRIVGLGIDTLSPDRPDSDYPVHHTILGAGKYIIENVAQAPLLPPKGAVTFAFPLKIEQATESPIRLVGMI